MNTNFFLTLPEPMTFHRGPLLLPPMRKMLVSFHKDEDRKFILARVQPLLTPVVLYGPDDYDAQSAAPEEAYFAKLLELLGENIVTSLLPLQAKPEKPYWEK